MLYTQETNLQDYFSVRMAPLKCSVEVRSYIISTLCKFKGSEYDCSNYSIGIMFVNAKENHKFELHQNLGDWIFFCQTVLEGSLHHASVDYYNSICQQSYNSCYLLLNRQWDLFRELSEDLIKLQNQTKNLIKP